LANLLKPNTVKVVTQDGEVQVTISLELTINLNSDNLKISGSPIQADNNVIRNKQEKEPMWEIPDFFTGPKVDFGKRE
jgi:hypothetical protein